MNRRSIAWLALRSLAAAPGRTTALTLALGVALSLPLFALSAPSALARRGAERTAALPLVVGPPGSALDLVLAATTFSSVVAPDLPADTARRVGLMGAGDDVAVAAVHLGHRSGDAAVVGLDGGGLEFLGARPAEGRPAVLLGEAAAGARIAAARGLAPGDLVRTDHASVHDIGRSQTFALQLSGVLQPTGTALDDAFVVSLQTAWLLDGNIHGHATAADAEGAPSDGPDHLRTLRRVTDENRAEFHEHPSGDASRVSLLLVRPADDRARDLVLGELELDKSLQGVRPDRVLERLVSVMLELQQGVLVLAALVGLAVLGLVGALTSILWRARAEEARLLDVLGAPRNSLALLVAVELGTVATLGLGLAAALAWGATTVLCLRLIPG